MIRWRSARSLALSALLRLAAGVLTRVRPPGAVTLGGEHDWKDDSEPVASVYTWMRDADDVPVRLRPLTLSDVEPVSPT